MFFSLWVVQCIGAGYKSNIYVENSVQATAATQKKPWDCKTSGSYKDHNITLKGAGATLKVSYGSGVSKSRSVSFGDTDGQTTGICDFTEAASVLSTRIFTLKGNEVQTLLPGLNIVKTTYSDGHTDVKKVLKKQNNGLRDMIVLEAFLVIVTSMTSIY